MVFPVRIFLLLPNKGVENLLLIGPYLTSIPTSEQIMGWAEKTALHQCGKSRLKLIIIVFR